MTASRWGTLTGPRATHPEATTLSSKNQMKRDF